MEQTSNDLLGQLSELLRANNVLEADIVLWSSVAQHVQQSTTVNLLDTISQSPELIPTFTEIIRAGFSQSGSAPTNFDSMASLLQQQLPSSK